MMNSATSKVLVVILILFLLTTVINIAYHGLVNKYNTETADSHLYVSGRGAFQVELKVDREDCWITWK